MRYLAHALLLFVLAASAPLLAADTPELPPGPPAISGGAEAYFLSPRGPIRPDEPPVDALAPVYPGAGFDAFDFDDNSAVNGGYLFIPPDPIGAAGIDRLIAVVNAGIEARTKAGALLYRSSLQAFFAAAAGNLGTFCFDPKIVYDHHADRFVVIALERTDVGSGGASDESRILLAVSRTASPATATAADWYYHVIDAKVTIGYPTWADYPGLEVDEEAVYITVNQFNFSSTASAFGQRLWIVDKGLAGGFYAGGPAATAIHAPYTAAGFGGFETTTMPCEVSQPGGVGPGIGTYLLSYSGLTYGGPGNPEALLVIRVDNPLGATTFTGEFVTVGDIEDVGGVYGFPALPDAPQSGGAALIEVNDRRALDAVWRNGYIYLATTIIANTASDPVNAGQTTAHWTRLDATAVVSSASPSGLIALDQEGNIGGEDIAPGTYTFFPGLAVNAADELQIGFAASAPSIFGGAYVAGRVPGDAPGTVGPSGTVRAGIDYYLRTFGGPRNRWGDYSGVSVDPADDSKFWVYNQWADLRGTPISGEDGRWGTAWLECSFSASLPDLVVSAFSAPCCVYEGEQIGDRIFVEVTNQGPGASAACQLGLYVSPDPVIGAGDLGLLNGTLAVPPLAPGASAVLGVPANVTVPAGVAFGPQYLGAFVDDVGLVPEADDGNNTAATDAVVNADLFGCARGVASTAATGMLSVRVVPDGSGDALSAAQQFTGVGVFPAFVDATVTVALRDELGDPVPGALLTLTGSHGGLMVCGAPAAADGPTDAAGVATFSGPLYGGGHADVGAGEQLLVAGAGLQPIPGMVYGAPEMFSGGTSGDLYRVSLATGAASLICPALSINPDGSTEIEYDPASGTGWSASPFFYSQMTTFDWTTCGITGGPYATPGLGFNGLEWIGGSLFGTGIPNSCDPSVFVRMDPAAGTYVTIGATGVGPVSGLAWDPVCRRLYGVTGCANVFGTSDLLLIDVDTGVATVIGDTGVELGSLELGPDGRLYAGSNDRFLYVLDRDTGAATLIGPTGMGAPVSGLALVSDAGIPIRFNSPDLNGDLRVDLPDAGLFTALLFNGTYDYAADFSFDGVENLIDAGHMADGLGAACPGLPVVEAAVEDERARFVLDVVGTDAAGLLSLAPGEAGTARLVVTGALARTGVGGWEGRLETSDNVVIDGVDLAPGSLNLGRGGDFVVGFAESRRDDAGTVEVAVVRFHVADDAAAVLKLEAASRSSVGGAAPAVLAADGPDPLVAAGVVRYQDGAAAVINALPDAAAPQTAALDLRTAPNPFNPRTEISFNLPRSGRLEVRVYDLRGRLVWTESRDGSPAGAQTVVWEGVDRRGQAATSGTYFYQLYLDGRKLGAPGKMTLLK